MSLLAPATLLMPHYCLLEVRPKIPRSPHITFGEIDRGSLIYVHIFLDESFKSPIYLITQNWFYLVYQSLKPKNKKKQTKLQGHALPKLTYQGRNWQHYLLNWPPFEIQQLVSPSSEFHSVHHATPFSFPPFHHRQRSLRQRSNLFEDNVKRRSRKFVVEN